MHQVSYRRPGVLAVEVSQAAKLGPVSATYVSQASCPGDCPFLGAGCYAEYGHVGIHTERLNAMAEARSLTPRQLAENEADVIDELSGVLDLRLHVVGDCSTEQAVHPVAHAAGRYVRRGNRRVWTYTHAWRHVAREHWHSVSVLASCEDAGQVEEAWARGYAAAITLPRFPTGKGFLHQGLKVLPCPEQASGRTTCARCRLCFNDSRLLKQKAVIGFAAHGAGKKRLPLPVLGA